MNVQNEINKYKERHSKLDKEIHILENNIIEKKDVAKSKNKIKNKRAEIKLINKEMGALKRVLDKRGKIAINKTHVSCYCCSYSGEDNTNISISLGSVNISVCPNCLEELKSKL